MTWYLQLLDETCFHVVRLLQNMYLHLGDIFPSIQM